MGAATDKERLGRAVSLPGRLVLGPTTTTGAFPYGGVSLGFHSDGELVWRTDQILDRDPMSGRIVNVTRKGADFPEIYCLLEGPSWDEDALAATFQKVTRYSSLTYQEPHETRLEGTSVPLSTWAWPPLLFVAYDLTQPCVYIERPLPTLSLKQSVALSQSMKAGLPMRFIASPTASGKDWQVARLENLVL